MHFISDELLFHVSLFLLGLLFPVFYLYPSHGERDGSCYRSREYHVEDVAQEIKYLLRVAVGEGEYFSRHFI